MLAASDDKSMVIKFIGGEMGVYVLYKVVRQDYLYWVRLSTFMSVLLSTCTRVCGKIVGEFKTKAVVNELASERTNKRASERNAARLSK